jgi:hypothetical protein
MKHLVFFCGHLWPGMGGSGPRAGPKIRDVNLRQRLGGHLQSGRCATLWASYAPEVVLVNPKDRSKTTLTRQQLAAEEALNLSENQAHSTTFCSKKMAIGNCAN